MKLFNSLFGSNFSERKFLELHELSPKRYRIRDKPGSSCTYFWDSADCWAVAFPFSETAQIMFENETGIRLKRWRHGFGQKISESQKNGIKAGFDKKYLRRVFLRTLFDSAISLDLLRPTPTSDYTKAGLHFWKAKYNKDTDSITKISNAMAKFVSETACFKNADAILPMPASPGKAFDLPTELAKHLSKKSGIPLLSGKFGYQKPKAALKDVPLADKWAELQRADPFCEIDGRCAGLILIDDLYQSGATGHFWGEKLAEAGVREINLLTVVKSSRDTDNQ